MNAKEIIEELAELAAMRVGCSLPRPGDMIERLPDEKRAILQELKSDDIKDNHHPMMAYVRPKDWPEGESLWSENSVVAHHRRNGTLGQRWEEDKRALEEWKAKKK